MKRLFLALCMCTAVTFAHSMQHGLKKVVKISGTRLIGLLPVSLVTYVFSDDVHKYVDAQVALTRAREAEIRARLPKQ